jgi:hypothetical protein
MLGVRKKMKKPYFSGSTIHNFVIQPNAEIYHIKKNYESDKYRNKIYIIYYSFN